MGREPEAWEDRASWSSDCSITTCKESWDTLRLGREVTEVKGAGGLRGRAESRGLGTVRSGKISRDTRQDRGPGGGGVNHPSPGTGLECGPSAHSPPLLVAPGSGPPSSPPESSSLRAAPGAERAPLPAPTETGSPGAWPARAAALRRAARDSHPRESRWPGRVTWRRPVLKGGPRPLAPRPLLASRAPPPARLSPRPAQAPPLSCRQSQRLNYPVRSRRSLALSLLPRFWLTLGGHGSLSRPPGAGKWEPGL